MKIKIIKMIVFLTMWSFITKSQSLPAEIPNVNTYQMVTTGSGNGPSGLASNDNFGRSVANIGDLDNDGIDDIAVGSPNDAGGGTNRGAVYICFMNADGTVKTSPAISQIEYTMNVLSLSDNDYFGTSVAGIGDLNGDGYEDIAVGAYGNNFGGNNETGAVYIIFLNSTGGISGSPVKITTSTGGFGGTLQSSARFGMSVASIGDVNNDGKKDIAVGAPGHTSSEGQVWILRLRSNGQVKSDQEIMEGTNFDGNTLDGSDEFGYSLAATGDLNKDGINDLVVGAPGDDDGYSNAGAFWILYLDSTSAATDVKKLSCPLMDNYYYPNTTDVSFGRSVGVSDVNEDGSPDLLAGVRTFNSNKGGFYFMLLDSLEEVTNIKMVSFQYAWSYAGPATSPELGAGICEINTDGDPQQKQYLVGAPVHNAGSAGQGSFYVLNMDALSFFTRSGSIINYTKISDFSGDFSGTLANSCFFGIDAAAIGDINNDGNMDVAVGAHGDNTGFSGGGAVWILLLDELGKVTSYQKINSGTTNFTTLGINHNFGVGVGPAGDFDNDGVEDILVGSIGDDVGGGDNGAVYLIYLNNDGTVKTYDKIAHIGGTPAVNEIPVTSFFGQDVDTLGDLDGNGVVDLVVGAPRNDDGGSSGNNSNRGAVHIVYMKSDGTVKKGRRISDTQGSFFETFVDGMGFGSAVDGIGDFNGDGIPDIAVGAGAADNTGAAYIICLDTNATVKSYTKINYASGNFPYALPSLGAFGGSVQMVDDIDGNGVSDLLIGHQGRKTYGISARGGIWIAFLDQSANVIDAHIITDSTGLYTNMNTTYALGQCVRFAGYDAAGNIKLLAGVRDDDGGTDRGGLLQFNVITHLSKPMHKFVDRMYAIPKKQPDEMYYETGWLLKFIHNEEYNDADGLLDYKIFKIDNHATVAVYTNQLVKIVHGQNRCSLNLNTILSGSPLPPGYYTMEITNDKKEKTYIKIKKI